MNILYVLNSASPGGMEAHVVNLVQGMLSRGHCVHVWGPKGNLFENIQNKNFIHIERFVKYDIDPNFIYSLKKYLKETSIDVVHAHELKCVINSLLAGWLAGTKIRISHTHTPISVWRINIIKKIFNLFVNTSIVNLLSTRELALTSGILLQKKKEGISAEKLAIVVPGNGLHVNEFIHTPQGRLSARATMCEKYGFDKSRFLIMNLGRLSIEKGHDLIIKAYQQLCTDSKFKADTQLIFAGGGPLESEIRENLASMKLNAVVTGRFVELDRYDLFATPDVFVSASLAEGWGLVAVESLLSNNVTLLSDLPVFHETCKEYPFYFKPNDVASLVKTLRSMYEDYADYKRHLEVGRMNLHKEYNMDRFISAYESFYMGLLV